MAFKPDQVPPRVEEKGGGFFGRPLRDVWIVGMGLALALMAALWLPGPVWLKIAVGMLLAGLGLAIGLGRDQGRWRFEERIVHLVRYQMRPKQRVWRRPGAAPAPVVIAAAPPEPELIPADEAQGFGQVRPVVDLWWGVVTAFVMSALSGVTAYLATGGAEDLKYWRLFVTR